MSIILDALRKSEHARDRRALPGFVDLPPVRAAHSRLPLILGGIGALLVVNVIVLGVVLLRRPAPPPAAATPAAATPAPAPVAPAPPAARMPLPGPPRVVRPLDAEAADATSADDDAADDAGAPARSGAPAHVVSRPPAPAGAAVEAGTAASAAPTRLPTLDDLPPQMASGLPRLNLDLHVWNKDPGQRWVVINGQRVKEGQSLREGPHLVEITVDGVVLDYNSTRFLLRHQ